MLIRSWNVFHGNTVPPQKHAFLEDMVRLASEDDPDVLCLQEVPAASLGEFTSGDLAARPKALSAQLGNWITDLNHGVLRSAVSGQGNAMQVSSRLQVLSHHRLTLNPRRFRNRQAKTLGLDLGARLAWAKERRIVQALRLADERGATYLVANTHTTSYHRSDAIAEAELLRAAWFATSTAQAGDVVVLAGDFNLLPGSPAVRALSSPEWGFSAPGPRIDHIVVRGRPVSELRVWPEERRAHNGRLLSDHAPVELELL